MADPLAEGDGTQGARHAFLRVGAAIHRRWTAAAVDRGDGERDRTQEAIAAGQEFTEDRPGAKAVGLLKMYNAHGLW
jgi:hypothetical protein